MPDLSRACTDNKTSLNSWPKHPEFILIPPPILPGIQYKYSKPPILFSAANSATLLSSEALPAIKVLFGNIETFELKFKLLRKYYYKNILSFGDLLHKIHPLAGQGFNMTIRDIKILSSLIDEKIELGLELDESLFYDFQKKTKHLNYIFGVGIDFIYEFFKIDNKINNLLSNSIFSVFGKNKLLKKYANLIADKGINI